jgi:hypothetical protein
MLLENAVPVSAYFVAEAPNSISLSFRQNREKNFVCKLCATYLVTSPNVSYGSNSEVELADADFRFTPESRHPAVRLECPFRQPILEMRRALFNHLVGAANQGRWQFEAKRLRGFEVDDQLVLGRRLHRQVGRFHLVHGPASCDAGDSARLTHPGFWS